MRVEEKGDTKIVIQHTDDAYDDIEYEFERMPGDHGQIRYRKVDNGSVTHESILVLEESNFTDLDQVDGTDAFEQVVTEFMQSSLKEQVPDVEL